MIKSLLASARNMIRRDDREEGQGMAEYGLILAGVALLAIVAVFLLGPQIANLLNKVSASLS